MKKILVIFAIFILTLPSFATQWKEISEDMQIDMDSIEPYINHYGNIEPDKFVFWVKKINNNSNIFLQLEKYYKKNIGYFVDKEVIDCKLKKISIKSNYIYDKDSKLIHKFDFDDFRSDWSSIVPDSKDQLLFKEVFNYKLKYDEEIKKNIKDKEDKEDKEKQ